MDLKVHHQRNMVKHLSAQARPSALAHTQEFPYAALNLSHSHSVVMHIFCSIAGLSGQAFGMRILKNIITQAKCSFPLE